MLIEDKKLLHINNLFNDIKDLHIGKTRQLLPPKSTSSEVQKTPRPKTTRRFKVVVRAIITMKKLYYTYHMRHQPVTKESVIKDPYGHKPVRRMIDSCVFKMYSHWVKRWPDQDQNRAALFQNTPKLEVKRSGHNSIPAFLYQLNSPWIKKASSYRQLSEALKRREDSSSSR